MPLYRMYPLHSDMLFKALIRENKKLRKQTFEEVFGSFLRSRPGMVGTLDFLIQLDEFVWNHSNKLTIFIPDLGLVDRLLAANYALADINALTPPATHFSIALPLGTHYEGVEIPPFMVSWATVAWRSENALRPYLRTMKMPETDFIDPDPSQLKISILMQASTRDPDTGLPGYLALNVVADQAVRVLQAVTREEMRSSMGELDLIGISGVNDVEMLQQFYALRLALSIVVYAQAVPEALVDGLPEARIKYFGPSVRGGKAVTLKLHSQDSTEDRTTGAHYRSWHFRQLMHERFYRHEHAHLSRGSRIIFVHDSIVNRDGEVKTLT